MNPYRYDEPVPEEKFNLSMLQKLQTTFVLCLRGLMVTGMIALCVTMGACVKSCLTPTVSDGLCRDERKLNGSFVCSHPNQILNSNFDCICDRSKKND